MQKDAVKPLKSIGLRIMSSQSHLTAGETETDAIQPSNSRFEADVSLNPFKIVPSHSVFLIGLSRKNRAYENTRDLLCIALQTNSSMKLLCDLSLQ